MSIYVYSDESGVFDNKHYEYFVFGGLIFLDKKERDRWKKAYLAAEENIRQEKGIKKERELKGSNLKAADKEALFKTTKDCNKFGIIIRQDKLLKRIYQSKKDKQRFLDYAYIVAVKKAFERLIEGGSIKAKEPVEMYCFTDEHTTSTKGVYELQENLEQEFKLGRFNLDFDKYYPSIFKQVNKVSLQYCDSSTNACIRGADILSHIIYEAVNYGNVKELEAFDKFYLIHYPAKKKK